LGEPSFGFRWPDYLHMGFTPEHVPELLRMALDEELGEWGSPECWATVYAWRVLGQLRAEAAVEPLLRFFLAEAAKEYEEQDEWAVLEIPEALAWIGPPALPALLRLLSKEVAAAIRFVVPDTLERLAEHHPAERDRVVATLVRELEDVGNTDPELIGSVVAALMAMRAVEAAPAIESAFRADRVDIAIPGDWRGRAGRAWSAGRAPDSPPQVRNPSAPPTGPRSRRTPDTPARSQATGEEETGEAVAAEESEEVSAKGGPGGRPLRCSLQRWKSNLPARGSKGG
jgi:hypothetical protein